MKLFLESIRFYMKNFEQIMLLSLTIVLPFLLAHIFLVNYWFLKYQGIISSFVIELLNALMLFAFTMLLKIPFIKFVYSDLEGEENKLFKSYVSFLRQGFSVFLFGILFAILVTIGLGLFILPGVLVIVFLYLTPYIAVSKNRTASESWRESIRIAKKRFLTLFLIIFVTALIEGILNFITLYGVSQISFKYNAVFTVQLLVNLIIFPILVIFMTLYVHHWKNEQYYLLQKNRSEEINV